MKKTLSLIMALVMIFTTLIVAIPLTTSAKETIMKWLDFDNGAVASNYYQVLSGGFAGLVLVDTFVDSGKSFVYAPWSPTGGGNGDICSISLKSQYGLTDVSSGKYLEFWCKFDKGWNAPHLDTLLELADSSVTAALISTATINFFPASGVAYPAALVDGKIRIPNGFVGKIRVTLSDFASTVDLTDLKSIKFTYDNRWQWFQDSAFYIDSINFIKDISLNYSSLSMLRRETKQLTASNTTITNWASSNEAIATVNSNGLVTSKSVIGSTTITATTSNGDTLTCAVDVAEVAKDTWLDFDNGALPADCFQVSSGGYGALGFTTAYADSGNSLLSSPWSAAGGGNGDICSISLKSQYGVTDVSSDTYLEFWCKFNKSYTSAHIDTLIELVDSSSAAALNSSAIITFMPTSGQASVGSLIDGKIRIPDGYAGKIRLKLSDFASTVNLANLQSIKLTWDNRWQWFQDSYFYIDSVNFVRVKPVITNLTLDRSALPLLKNDSKKLAANDDIESWTSSDEAVATVDSNGIVSSKGIYGSTVITAESYDGLTASCTVTVGQSAKDTFVDFDNGFVLTNEYASITSGEFVGGLKLASSPAEIGNALALTPWSAIGGGNGAICAVAIQSQYGFDVSGNEYLEFWCKYSNVYSEDSIKFLLSLNDGLNTAYLTDDSIVEFFPKDDSKKLLTVFENGNLRIPDGKEGKLRIKLSDFSTTINFSNLKAIGIAIDNRWLSFQDSTLYVDSFNFARSNFDVTGVTIAPETATLIEGQTLELSATVAPYDAENKAVNCTSDNEEVATVTADGVVTAVSNGTATISATSANGIVGTCTVTVVEPADFENNIISGSTITLQPGVTASGFRASIKVNGNAEIKYYDLEDNEITEGNLGSDSTIKVKNPNTNETATYSILVMGDLTGDGDIDTLDLIAMKNHLLHWTFLTGNCLLAANQTGNQEVGLLDLMILKDLVI